MSLSPAATMDTLPSELLTMILHYMEINDLGNCTLVEKRWNSVAKQVMLDQAKKIQDRIEPDVLRELGTHVAVPTEQMMSSVDLVLSLEEMKALLILQLHQNTFFYPAKPITVKVKPIRIGNAITGAENGPTTSKGQNNSSISAAQSVLEASFFSSLIPKANATKAWLSAYRRGGYLGVKVESVTFISCHNILVIPCSDNSKGPGKTAKFYVLSKRPKWEPNVEYIDIEPEKEWRWEEYGVIFKNVFYISWERISVYGDTILVAKPRNLKRFDLLKITEVDHKSKKIIMKREEEVVFEVEPQDFINFNGRIFITVLNDFTFLVVRDNEAKQQKRIEVFGHPQVNPCFHRKFYRMNNLIFIALKYNFPILKAHEFERRPWLIFDGNAVDPVVHQVDMTLHIGLLTYGSTDHNVNHLHFVESISCFNNVFIALCICREFGEKLQIDEDQPRCILVATMRRAPKLEDFLTTSAFLSLFSTTALHRVSGKMSPPFFYQGFYKSVSILGGLGEANSLYQFST